MMGLFGNSTYYGQNLNGPYQQQMAYPSSAISSMMGMPLGLPPAYISLRDRVVNAMTATAERHTVTSLLEILNHCDEVDRKIDENNRRHSEQVNDIKKHLDRMLVERLARAKTVNDVLRELAEENNLPTTGTKKELIKTLEGEE